MNINNIPGSRWWKFDFHTHTPKSDDYIDKTVSTEKWLLAHMEARIDAVVIADHNSGEWVDELKAELNRLRETMHPKFRELYIFPGTELAVNGGTHVILVFDPLKGSSDVAGIIRTCGYAGPWGNPAGRASMSLEQVLAVTQEQKALIIPAHVDVPPNGLWQMPDYGSQRNTLSHRSLFALERKSKTSTPPTAVLGLKKTFAEVLGSDSHKLADIGREFTWVKMGQPTLEGLRLALLDGNQSFKRSDDFAGDPNEAQAPNAIERFEVENAQFIGRAKTFVVEFSPWMNTLIGGRGTGKSSLLEFIRITLSRSDELTQFSDLQTEFENKYSAVWAGREAGGLQTPQTEFCLIYRKDRQRYRIKWHNEKGHEQIQEADGVGGWKTAAGDIASRFPVRIYSQKQIYELAENPSALIEIIDQDPAVSKMTWDAQWEAACNRYRAIMAKIRGIHFATESESRLRGELDDVSRKLAVLENSGNQAILQKFHQTQNQSEYLVEWGHSIYELPEKIRTFANEISLPDFDKDHFDDIADSDALGAAQKMSERITRLKEHLEKTAQEADEIACEWEEIQVNSEWNKRVMAAKADYEEIVKQLQEQGVADPSEFDQCIRQRQQLDAQLKDISIQKKDLIVLDEQRRAELLQILALRQELSDKREQFLRTVLRSTASVQINVVRYGNVENTVAQYRRIIRRDDGLEEDILSFKNRCGILLPLYDSYEKPVPDYLEQLQKIKNRTHAIATGPSDENRGLGAWFVKHLETKVSPEDLDELEMWFPEDSLAIQYRPREGEGFRPISQGSPGQKTAALLAFLLSYGTEPILLDQPEDDLDNQLIFNLITQQLIANKARRQVIVVTHNANIVVNGDAELVLALESKGGQTSYRAMGGLQDANVRKTICDVMEGGEAAFELRYRRIKEGLESGLN